MIRLGLVVAGFFLIYLLRDLILVILTSIVIASFMEAAGNRFKRFKLSRVSSIVILYIITLSVLAGIFYLFAPLLITEIYNFSTLLSSYLPNAPFLDYFHNDLFSGAKDVVVNLSHSLSLTSLLTVSKEFITNLSGGFFQILTVAFGGVFNVIMIIFISFYLSIQERGIENFLRVVVPPKQEDYAVDLWQRTSRKIALWIKGQLLLGLLVAILVYLVLSLVGIQYALLLAIITGILELIPYGFLIAMIPAVALAYLTGGITSTVMVLGAYLIIHQFEVYLLAPLIVRKIVGLSPLVVILAVVIGFQLAGFWGLVLAIPVAVCLMEFFNDMEKKRIFDKPGTEFQ